MAGFNPAISGRRPAGQSASSAPRLITSTWSAISAISAMR
jgi:hypothetical protein